MRQYSTEGCLYHGNWLEGVWDFARLHGLFLSACLLCSEVNLSFLRKFNLTMVITDHI